MLLEDPDTVSVLELVKEKLSGQLVAVFGNSWTLETLDINKQILLSISF